ncbi:MAG: helix-turn-helix domain-containing protein [Candidatus Paceibacterota bacterium]
MTEYWPMIPPSVIRDTRLNAVSVRVYAALAVYANSDTGECWPSQATLAADIGVSERCVREHIARLIQAGHVHRGHRRRRDTAVLIVANQDRNGCSGQTVKTGTPAHQDRHGCSVKTGTAVPDTIKHTKGTNKRTKEASAAFDILLSRWNAIDGVAKVLKPTDSRLRSYQARSGDDDWRHLDEALAKITKSSFCHGQNDRGWRADIDWFLRPDTMTKILEGKYDDRNGNGHDTGPHYDIIEPLR